MRQLSFAVLWSLGATLLLTVASNAAAGQIISTQGLTSGSSQIGGYYITPAPDVPGPYFSQDKSPSQVFEVIRPNMEAFSIGRMMTSCTCITLSADNRSFGQGERALLVLRNVKSTPAGGANYALFVQIANRGTLQYDLFIRSTGSPGSPRAAMPSSVVTPSAPRIVTPSADVIIPSLDSTTPIGSSEPVVVTPSKISGRAIRSKPEVTYEDFEPYAPKPSVPAKTEEKAEEPAMVEENAPKTTDSAETGKADSPDAPTDASSAKDADKTEDVGEAAK